MDNAGARRSFRWIIAGTAVALLAAGGLAAVLLDDEPRRHVAMPATDATPADVVRAYVDALDAHDFDTAGRLLTSESVEQVRDTWFEDVDRITDVQIGTTRAEEPRWTGHDEDEQVMRVPVTFDLRWRLLHNDGSLQEGPTAWGYLLVRGSDAEPWRIFDQGMG
ncbi:MAG: hypothetical protein ACRDPJ_21370 [Nocardioidaceae bacterium]